MLLKSFWNYTGWAKSSYTVINYILYTYFWPTLYELNFLIIEILKCYCCNVIEAILELYRVGQK